MPSLIFEVSPARNDKRANRLNQWSVGASGDLPVGRVGTFGLMSVGNCRMVRRPQRFEAALLSSARHVRHYVRIAEGPEPHGYNADFHKPSTSRCC